MAGGVKPLHHQSKTTSWKQNLDNRSYIKDTNCSMKVQSEHSKKKQFDFPEGGWECSKCQNYNFKGRKECYRCKKAKDSDDFDGKPKHMFLPEHEKAALKAEKANKRISKNRSSNPNDSLEEEVLNTE